MLMITDLISDYTYVKVSGGQHQRCCQGVFGARTQAHASIMHTQYRRYLHVPASRFVFRRSRSS
jgi:hypothetical protein